MLEKGLSPEFILGIGIYSEKQVNAVQKKLLATV